MSKGAAFEAIWNKLHSLDAQNANLRDMRYVPEELTCVINRQNLLIAALVEAGILIEKKEDSKKYLQFGKQKYTIRKVK